MPLLGDRNKTLEYDPNSIFRASKYVSNVSSANLAKPAKNPAMLSKASKDSHDVADAVSTFIGNSEEVLNLANYALALIGDRELTERELEAVARKDFKNFQKFENKTYGTVQPLYPEYKGGSRHRRPSESLESASLRQDRNEVGRLPYKRKRQMKTHGDSLSAYDKKEAVLEQEDMNTNYNKVEGPRFTRKFENRPELVIKAYANGDRILDQGLSAHLKPFERDMYQTNSTRKTYEIGTEGEHKIGGLRGGAGSGSDSSDSDSSSDEDSDEESEDEESEDEEPEDEEPEGDGEEEEEEGEGNIYPQAQKITSTLQALSILSSKISKLYVEFKKVKRNFNKLSEGDVDDIETLYDKINETLITLSNSVVYYGVEGASLVSPLEKKWRELLTDIAVAIRGYAPLARGAGRMRGGQGQGMPRTGFTARYNDCPTKYLL